MKNFLRHKTLLVTIILACPGFAIAQTEIELLMPAPRDIIPEVSDGLFLKFETVGKLLDENNVDKALLEVQQLEKRSLNKYERAAV